jgi:hypothetical protein
MRKLLLTAAMLLLVVTAAGSGLYWVRGIFTIASSTPWYYAAFVLFAPILLGWLATYAVFGNLIKRED